MRNDATGEICEVQRPVRFDPDANVYHVGDGRQVHGNKFWHADVRGKGVGRLAIIAVDHVPTERPKQNSENHIMMKNFRRIARLTAGVSGAITGGVAHGVEIDELQRDFNWVRVAPVSAGKLAEKIGKTDKEKQGCLNVVKFPACRRGNVDISYYDVRLVKREMLEDGTSAFVDLIWKGSYARENKNGTDRRHVVLLVTCHCREHKRVHRESTITSAANNDRTLKRGENVRAVPPHTPVFDALYPLRSAIEGENSQTDNHLTLRRARSYGARRQLLDLVGHAQSVTFYGLYRYGPGGEDHHEVDPAEAAGEEQAAQRHRVRGLRCRTGRALVLRGPRREAPARR